MTRTARTSADSHTGAVAEGADPGLLVLVLLGRQNEHLARDEVRVRDLDAELAATRPTLDGLDLAAAERDDALQKGGGEEGDVGEADG